MPGRGTGGPIIIKSITSYLGKQTIPSFDSPEVGCNYSTLRRRRSTITAKVGDIFLSEARSIAITHARVKTLR